MAIIHRLHGVAGWTVRGTGVAMDFLVPQMQVLLWTLVVFGLLLLILKKFAWGPLLSALDAREKRIQARFDDAAREIAEAEKRVVEYEEKIAHVKDQAAEIIAEAKRDVERVRLDVQAQAEREAEKILQRAKREIHLAKEAAAQELRDQLVDLTTELTARIIEREVRKEDHVRFVENAINLVVKEKEN